MKDNGPAGCTAAQTEHELWTLIAMKCSEETTEGGFNK